ncbi:MAG: hypothetical protein NZ585_07750 [Chloracidobacterium sp.]|nr:hypothetical protein [Chloracidobacterium sp.]MDW8218096.1 hypothetical protein [Acidobacteriota bacterium]
MTRASRWSPMMIAPVVISLWLSPLACVLTCLLGGCAQSTRSHAAHTVEVLVSRRAALAAARPSTTSANRPETTARCCAATRAKTCRPKTAGKPALLAATQTATDEPVVVARQYPTAHLTDWDTVGCGCCRRLTEPNRFTASPFLTLTVPLPSPAEPPVIRTAASRLETRLRTTTYLPSYRETYLRCCVFRI